MRVKPSRLTRRRKASTSCDLPMPPSPLTSTAWPRPSLLCDQRSIKSASSVSRPTSSAAPVASAAASRSAAVRSRTAANTRAGRAIPLRSWRPRSSSEKLSATMRAVTSLSTAELGAARPCSRAARLGVSPTTLTSRARLSPITSPTTTGPVAIPIRVARSWPLTAGNSRTAAIARRLAVTARSAASSLACG